MFFIDLIVLFILFKLVYRIDKWTRKSNPGFTLNSSIISAIVVRVCLQKKYNNNNEEAVEE